MANGRAGAAKVRCEDCFFHQNLLCAISDASPCATYRPNHPDGLRPPSQLRFVFRQERRMQVAWAFPSASEQVALHAQQPGVPAGLYMVRPGVYWPLIIGFVVFVVLTVLIGWLVDPARRGDAGNDRH